MDLGTVKSNLKSNKYKTFEAFSTDVLLIWSNCKIFNQQGSVIYVQAEKMERKSKKLLKVLKEKISNNV